MKFLNKGYVNIKNLHLAISVILIVPVALIYGLYPDTILSTLLDLKADTINLVNIFRSIMGLYLAMSVIWIIGIVKPSFWVTATITNIVFMGGLATGRLLSLVIDGLPGIYLLTGLIVELLFALWGLRNLKKYAG